MQSENKILLQLNEAVRRLRAQGIIKWEKDIATDLKYEPPTVNQYLKGNKVMSAEFISRFEKKYKMKLSGIILPDKSKKQIITDTNTKLLVLIAKKLGVRDQDIEKALR